MEQDTQQFQGVFGFTPESNPRSGQQIVDRVIADIALSLVHARSDCISSPYPRESALLL